MNTKIDALAQVLDFSSSGRVRIGSTMREWMRWWVVLVFGLGGIGVQADSVKLTADMARQHVVMVDRLGRHLDPAGEWDLGMSGGNCDCTDNFRRIEKGIGEFLAARPDGRVAVFVHGGLNAYSTSKKRLETMRGAMLADGVYPVLVVWNSGLFSAYGERVALNRQGEENKALAIPTAPFVLGIDLAKGVVRLPLTLAGRYYNDLLTVEVSNGLRMRSWEDLERTISDIKAQDLGVSSNAFVHPPSPERNTRTASERWVQATRYTLTQPTKIVTLPIVDGMGAEAWEMMKRRTKTMFEPPRSYEYPRDHRRLFADPKVSAESRSNSVRRWLSSAATQPVALTRRAGSSIPTTNDGTLHRFARQCEQWTVREFPRTSFELYGHSMGTMVLNELLRHGQGIRARRIVYMAAACSVRDFEESVVSYLRGQPDTHFYSLSLHRVRESGEMMDLGLDLIPRGSLLSYIDEVFESPETVADRTLGSWRNLVRATPDFADIEEPIQRRLHFVGMDLRAWADFAGSKQVDPPQKHGGFSGAPFWRDAFLERRSEGR